MRAAGGPSAVRSFIARHNSARSAFTMASACSSQKIAGLNQEPELFDRRQHSTKRATRFPPRVRQAAFNQYLSRSL